MFSVTKYRIIRKKNLKQDIYRITFTYAFRKYFLSLLLLRESEREGGGAEREGKRIPSRLCAVSGEPDIGLDLTNLS